MKLRSMLPFLAVAILQGGCGVVDPPPRNCFSDNFTPIETIHRTVVPVGEEAVVEMRLDRPSPCASSSDPVAHREELAVYDPANYPVEAELIERGQNAFAVRFTPLASGHYHLSLRSSPDGSAAQLEVVAAIDRRDDPRVSLGENCTRVARTGSGAMVCDSRVFVNGVLAATLPDYDSVVGVDSAIWTLSETTLRRWVHGPAGITGPLEVEFPDVFPMGAPSFIEEEALLMRGSAIERYRVVEGALVLVGALEPEVGWVGRADDIRRMGDVAFAVVAETSPRFETEVCSFALLAEGGIQRTQTACQTLRGDAIGANEQELWTLEPSVTGLNFDDLAIPLVLRRFSRDDAQLIVSSSVLIPSSVGAAVADDTGRPASFIAFSGQGAAQWVFARFVDGEIRLEKFSDAADFLAATPHGLWFREAATDAGLIGDTQFLEP